MSRLLSLTFFVLSLTLYGCPETPVPGDDDDSGDDDDATDDDDDSVDDDDSSSDDDDSSSDDDDSSSDDDDSGDDDDSAASTSPRRVIGYFTSWSVYARDFHVADIPASNVTHINYAFANVTGGECVLGDAYADIDKFYPGDSWDAGALRGNFNQLNLLKAAHPGLQTLLSVGGWTWSGNFSDAALTPSSRATFASSCVDLIRTYGFDGIDIDWEYPVAGGLGTNTNRPEDRENYTLLLQEIRSQLDSHEAADGQDYLLTIAAPANPVYIANLELPELAGVLDWINVMTYDYHGGWEMQTGLQSPLAMAPGDPFGDAAVLNVEYSLQSFLWGGVPADQLTLGIPFYGRGWSGVGATNDGLFQAATGVPAGTWEAGNFDYHDVIDNWASAATVHWEPTAQVPWVYDAAQQVMITYDDVTSAALKSQWVLDQNLGGVMFWEFSGDTSDPSTSLALAIHDALNAGGR